MPKPLVLVGLLWLAQSCHSYVDPNFVSPWTFTCEGTGDAARCVKSEAGAAAPVQSLNHCKLICGTYGPLWPKPRGIQTLGTEVTEFPYSLMSASITAPDTVYSLLTQNVDIFLNHMNMNHPEYDPITGSAPWTAPPDSQIANRKFKIELNVVSEEDRLSLSTDESYNLTVALSPLAGGVLAKITATTFFGARHGLESLSQLINYSEKNNCLQVVNVVTIDNDAPTFPYRGILIDSSRNFLPIETVKGTLDAMSSTKLNTLHWHITDTQSFPIVVESVPEINQYGAYSAKKLYYPDEIRAIVEYGRVRGIRVMPELDAPAHVGNGFQWGPKKDLGNLALCINQEPWRTYCYEPPCGQLNLANENIYAVLAKVYKDFAQMFQPMDLFHFGGDEVNLECWNTTSEMVEWMQTVGDGTLSQAHYLQEWSNFQNKVFNLSTLANNGTELTGILWTSTLTETKETSHYIDKDKYIIEVWTRPNDPVIKDILNANYRVIYSNLDPWYLSAGFGPWVGAATSSPYHGWQKVYDNLQLGMDPSSLYHKQVMGGEAAVWSEKSDEMDLNAKLWPRGAALGERLWSNPSWSWRHAEHRMVHHRQRMVQRGVAAERLQPEWCYQNEGLCYA